MNDPQHNHIEQLRLLDLSLRSQLELAEARVQSINEVIVHLAEAQVVSETAIVGLIIYEGLNNVLTESINSGQVVQAALTVPYGFGVINWSSEEFASFRKTPTPDAAGLIQLFVPFDRCPTGIKALLLPHVQPLLDLLLRNVRSANRGYE